MKTASEYLKGHKANREYPSYYHENDIEEMIKAARKEAIEAAAERATVNYEFDSFDDKVIAGSIKVDKQSILSIITELK